MLSSAGIGFGIFGVASQINFLSVATPGADFTLSIVLGFLLAVPIAIIYGYLSSVYSRSGADYVWNSRLVNSVLGFVAGFGLWVALLLWLGTEAVLFGTVGLSQTLTAFGALLGNSALINLSSTLAQTSWVFITGMIMVVGSALLACSGHRMVSRAMLVMTIISLVSIIVAFGILATSTHADFIAAMNGYAGSSLTYESVISDAQGAGWSFVPISWALTIPSIPLGFLYFIGFNNATTAAGEVKRAKSRMPLAIIGCLIPALIFNVIGCQLSSAVFGNQFLYAAVNDPKWPLAAAPWMILFLSMLTKNTLFLFVIHLGWLSWFLWWYVSVFIMPTRYVFAFSFDRVFPAMFADVNDRLHMPVKAMILNIFGAVIMFVVTLFITYVGAFLNAVALTVVVYLLGCVSAIIIPIKKKDIASLFPGSTWKIPFISIVGVIALVTNLYIFYLTFTVPAIGPSTPLAAAIFGLTYLIGIAVYVTKYYYLKSRGLDLKLVYSEIPPE
jgi:amino acid transporter